MTGVSTSCPYPPTSLLSFRLTLFHQKFTKSAQVGACFGPKHFCKAQEGLD